jgi:cell division protein FtsB
MGGDGRPRHLTSVFMFLLQRIPTSLYITCASLVALGYFVYHSENGKYGFRASVTINEQVASLEAELDDLQERRESLEHQVELMRPESLDPDMLDERARANLNYAHPLELVILHSE